MKRLYTLLLLSCISTLAYNQQVNYTVTVTQIQWFENGIGGACQEAGDEEYTALVWFDDNLNGTNVGGNCFTCNNNGNCTISPNTQLGGRNNTCATTINMIFEGWEDDTCGGRCTYDTGTFCNNDDCHCGPSTVASINFRNAGPGCTTYGYYGCNTGNHRFLVQICYTEAVQPNDVCSNAIAVGTGTTNFNLIEECSGPDITNCAFNDYNDIWYSYTYNGTCPLSSWNVNTFGTGFDTALSLWSACGGTQLGCNDDSGGLQSSITQTGCIQPGTTYYIRVSGYNGADGPGVLNITATPETAAPTFTNCPTQGNINANASCQATIPNLAAAATATDNCDNSVTITQSPAAGTIVGIGAQSVTLTATDDCGNSISNCVVNFNVVDVTNPSIICPGTQTIAGNASCQGSLGNYVGLAMTSDACPGTINVSQSPAPGTTISNSGTVTLTATDAAGNSATCTFTVNVTDTTPPTITCPGNQTLNPGINCEANLLNYAGLATANDGCSMVNVTQSPSPGTTISNTTTVTLTATDGSNNTNTCTFDVELVDNMPPTFICPATQTLALNPTTCIGLLPGYPLSNLTDNCSSSGNIAVTQSPIGLIFVPPYTITVTLMATDEAGNSDACDFTVNFVDSTSPNPGCPSDITVEGCDTDDIMNGGMTGLAYSETAVIITEAAYTAEGGSIAEACGLATITYIDVSNGTCPITVTRSFVFTDDSGNSNACAQSIQINDTTNPIGSSPAPLSVQCTADIPTPDISIINTMDNCTALSMVSFIGDVSDNGACAETITRTYQVTDDCGNTSDVTQTITIDDDTPPMPVCQNIAVTIAPGGQASITTADIDNGSSDNCTAAGNLILSLSQTTFNCTNIGTPVTVTLTVEDECGNTATCDAMVTVSDPANNCCTPPTAACQDIAVQLDANGNVTVPASDIDNGSVATCGVQSLTLDNDTFSCANLGDNTVTFTITDINGDTDQCTATITVRDDTPPTASNPAPILVQCSVIGPPSPDITVVTDAEDNCTPTVAFVNDALSGTVCPQIITRTYSVTDETGNSINVTQTITINDDTPPVLTVPVDAIVECNNSFAGTENAIIINDNFSTGNDWTVNTAGGNANGEVLFNGGQAFMGEATPNGPGAAVAEICRTFNTTNFTNITLQIAAFQSNAGFEGTDNLTITYDTGGGATTLLSDPEVWQGVDGQTGVNDGNTQNTASPVLVLPATADNNASLVICITVTVNDSNEDYFVSGLTLSGEATTPAANVSPSITGNATATDNCSAVTPTYTDDLSTLTACGTGTFVRTWTVSDECGNTVSNPQNITIEDTTPPALSATPADITVACIGDIPGDPGITATDTCDDMPTVTFTQSTAPACPGNGIITNTWLATDCAGNSVSHVQTVTIDDNTPPVLSAMPADVTVDCAANAPSDLGITATDSCDDMVNVTFTQSTAPACPGNGIITNTWLATDCAGNTTTHVQTVTIDDNTPPALSTTPANVTVDCAADVPGDSGITATDNCGETLTVTFVQSAVPACPGDGTVTNTWLATDCAGNTTTHVQTVTIDDNTLPILSATPVDVTVDCVANIPSDSGITATDNCGETLTVTFVQSAVPACPGDGTVTNTWMATDCAGNTTTHVQTVTIDDNTLPVLSATPADITVDCAANIPNDPGITATDNCGETLTVTFVQSAVPACPGDGTVTNTWTATDCAGNIASYVQTITIDDNTLPVLSATPADITVDCAANIPNDPGITATDNCGETLTVTFVQSAVPACPGDGTVTNTWTATDCAGNIASHVQTITIDDNTPPVLSATPADVTVDCAANIPNDPGITATDNCGEILTVTFTQSAAPSCSGDGTVTNTWTATDCAGNIASYVQTITIDDNTPPVLSATPADITVDCAANIPNDPGLTATDNCGETLTVTFVQSAVPTCPGDGTVTNTWTATDCAGNIASHVQTITIDDNTPPVLSATPADVTVQCSGDIPGDPGLTATDNCGETLTVTFTQSAIPSCPGIGTLTNTWAVIDCAGNATNYVQTVTLDDDTTPTPVCQNVSVFLDANGQASITTTDIDNGSSDNCTAQGNLTLSLDQTTFDCTDAGQTVSVVLTVTDECGNSANCTADVTVNDDSGPSVANCPSNISVNNDVGECGAIINYDLPEFGDNCGSMNVGTLVSGLAPGSLFPVGITTVTYEYTDLGGNGPVQCTFDIEVIDNEPPQAICQDITVGLDANGELMIVAADVDGGSTDNCGIASIGLDMSDFDCNNTGANTVMLMVVDDAGNTSSCTAAVTIPATPIPTLNCPSGNVTLKTCDGPFFCELDDDNPFTVNFSEATVSGTAVPYLQGDTSPGGNAFFDPQNMPIGVPLTLTYTLSVDACMSVSVTCVFTVEVSQQSNAGSFGN